MQVALVVANTAEKTRVKRRRQDEEQEDDDDTCQDCLSLKSDVKRNKKAIEDISDSVLDL